MSQLSMYTSSPSCESWSPPGSHTVFNAQQDSPGTSFSSSSSVQRSQEMQVQSIRICYSCHAILSQPRRMLATQAGRSCAVLGAEDARMREGRPGHIGGLLEQNFIGQILCQAQYRTKGKTSSKRRKVVWASGFQTLRSLNPSTSTITSSHLNPIWGHRIEQWDHSLEIDQDSPFNFTKDNQTDSVTQPLSGQVLNLA